MIFNKSYLPEIKSASGADEEKKEVNQLELHEILETYEEMNS